MIPQFSAREALFLLRLQSVDMQTYWGAIFERILHNPTVYNVRFLIIELLCQYQDDPKTMDKILGFNLPKLLDVKLYKPDEINDQLAKMRFAYRVLEQIKNTEFNAQWCAMAGYFNLEKGAGTVYVDSDLNRYIRLGNGQIFSCSNTDLINMPEGDKATIKAYLTGLID